MLNFTDILELYLKFRDWNLKNREVATIIFCFLPLMSTLASEDSMPDINAYIRDNAKNDIEDGAKNSAKDKNLKVIQNLPLPFQNQKEILLSPTSPIQKKSVAKKMDILKGTTSRMEPIYKEKWLYGTALITVYFDDGTTKSGMGI